MQKDFNLIKKQIKEMQSKHKLTKDKNANFKILADIAKFRLGRIKDGEQYINSQTKMIFIDKSGNEFQMSPNGIKQGKWSPYESGNVYNNPEYHMKQLQEIVSGKGGKIKDGEQYINSQTKMIFIDKSGNEFKMIPNAVKRGCWSPYESGNVNKPEYHMKQLEEIVSEKGGEIKKGEHYINNSTKMTFIDQLGNEFKMRPSDVKKGQWSPYEKNCSEHICRQIIEQIYNHQFPSVWNIIKRENGNRLQLDGYCKKLNIAFEYQGVQHKKGWNNKNKDKQEESLLEITERDNEKKQVCKDLKILLIEVNYYKNFNNIDDIIKQTIVDIKNSYESFSKKLPFFIRNLNVSEIKVDLSKISHLVLMQKEIEGIVSAKGGKIKEGEMYINNNTKMIFIDKLGNEFKMSPSHIKSGSWSPYESGLVRDSKYHMKKLQEIATSKDGKIKKGEVYVNAKTKIIFIDKFDNEFKMRPSDVKQGQWSPYESGLVRDSKYHMKKLQEIATSKDGKIKEGEVYVNAKTKIIFIDKFDNEFKISPDKVKRGSWSPFESGNVRNNPEYH